MKTKIIVFDMAGTSVDEGNVVYKTLHKAIEKTAQKLVLIRYYYGVRVKKNYKLSKIL